MSWNINETPINEEHLLKSLVKSRQHRVACVGCFLDVRHDPTPAFLSTLVSSKHVTVIEPQDRPIIDDHLQVVRPLDKADKLARKGILKGLEEAIEKKKAKGKVPEELIKRANVLRNTKNSINGDFGMGGITSYLYSGWKSGILKKKLRINIAFAHDTGLREKSTDLLVDRGTMHFLSLQGKHSQALGHYLSRIKQNGKIALIALKENSSTGEIKKMLSALSGQGKIHVEEHRIISQNYTAFPNLELEKRYPYDTCFVVSKLNRF